MAINQGPFTTGSQYTAADQVSEVDESNNTITSSGIIISEGDRSQTAKAIANYSSFGDVYKEAAGSAADIYVLENIDTQKEVTKITNGMVVRFFVVNTNTGSATVNLSGLGVKNIKDRTGNDPRAGQMTAGDLITLMYDGTNFVGINFRRIFETKTLSANQTSSGTMSDLTFNLTAGNTYRITGTFRMNEADTGAQSVVVQPMDNSVSLNDINLSHTPNSDTASVSLSFYQIHTMVGATLTFDAAFLSGSESISGDGSTLLTYVQVEEVDSILLSGTVE